MTREEGRTVLELMLTTAHTTLCDTEKEAIKTVTNLLSSAEEQKQKWLQSIIDNQLAISDINPLTEYERGKWDGLQVAFDILTKDR